MNPLMNPLMNLLMNLFLANFQEMSAGILRISPESPENNKISAKFECRMSARVDALLQSWLEKAERFLSLSTVEKESRRDCREDTRSPARFVRNTRPWEPACSTSEAAGRL